MMVLNCRSVESKVEDLSGLISFVQADIVLGTESWLVGSLSVYEVFPSACNAYRNDRLSQGEAYSYWSYQLDVPGNTIESLWCSVGLPEYNHFTLGVFYRLPNSDPATIEVLHDLVSSISNYCVGIGGDINLPDRHIAMNTVHVEP